MKENRHYNISVSINHHQDLKKMLWSVVRSAMEEISWIKKKIDQEKKRKRKRKLKEGRERRKGRREKRCKEKEWSDRKEKKKGEESGNKWMYHM